MKKMIAAAALSIGVFAFAGCAASATSESTTPKAPNVELPTRVAGGIQLGSLADHEIQMLQRQGDVTLKVRLCVAPDGKVADAKLVKASGHDHYDRVVVDSIRSWKYQPYIADKAMRVCKTVRVKYNAG